MLDCHGITISWVQTSNITHYNVTVIGDGRVQFTNETVYIPSNFSQLPVNPAGVSDPTMQTIDMSNTL